MGASCPAATLSASHPSGWFGAFRILCFTDYPLIENDSIESGGSTLANLALGWRGNAWNVQVVVVNLFDSDDHDIDYF